MISHKWTKPHLLILILLLSTSLGVLFQFSQVSFQPEQRIRKFDEINIEFHENPSPEKEDLRSQSVYTPPKYTRYAAYGYAKKWWDGANPHYNDYSGSGGDCANFVSQCLIAGGLSLHNGTDGTGFGVYPDELRASDSLGTIPYCDYLDAHLRNYQDTTVTTVLEGSAYIPEEISVGDVIIFGESSDEYEHAMIVVWDNGTYDVGLSGHSSQVWNRSFWTEIGYSTFDRATFYHREEGKADYYHFRVATGALNVRTGPGKNNISESYSDIGNIYEGDEYVAFGREKDEQGRWWWHFWFDDRAAWTAAWYTENATGNRILEVDVDSYLNVRDGPGTGYAIYGQVFEGMRFVSDATEGSWYRFWYGGEQKYSHGGYLDELQLKNNTQTNFTKPVMGFLPYWVSSDQNFSIISHLAWFSIELNADGTLGTTHGWPDWDTINKVHEVGNKIILTATLFNDEDIRTLLTSYKQTAADTLLEQVQAGNADGICIDFELPKSGDGELLVEFMHILYETFKNARNDYHISLCTPTVDWRNTFDYGDLDPYVDAFMLMGYGYSWSGSAIAGPTSPLESGGQYNWYLNWSVNDHLAKGAPKSKLILGLPFYGYDYPVENQNPHSSTRASGSSRTYAYIYDTLIPTYSPTILYNESYECAWFNYYVGGDGWRQIWFDNYTSLERKFQYILDRDLGGVGIWAYGYQGAHTELEQLIADKFMCEAEPHYPPGEFTLVTNAQDPDMDGSFYLNWTHSAGSETYSVYKSPTPMYTPGSGRLLMANITTNYTLISNCLSGENYYAVVAHNSTGSTVSNNVWINVSLPLDLTSNAGKPDKDGTYTLQWDEVSSVDNYSLYWYPFPITEINDTINLIEDGITENTYPIQGIANNSILYYIVLARRQEENMTSNYLKVRTLYGPPGEFTAWHTADDPDTDGQFEVKWTIPDAGTYYSVYKSNSYIYRITTDAAPLVIDTVTPNQFISDLSDGTYYLIVVAFNTYGNSTSNCMEVVIDTGASASDQDETPDPEGAILEFIQSPLGLTLLSIGGLSLGGIILFKVRKSRAYKSTLKEREKLQQVSQHAKMAHKKKRKR